MSVPTIRYVLAYQMIVYYISTVKYHWYIIALYCHGVYICYAQVYNVSSFMDHHPGGLDQILCAAGRDITQVFECYHPTSAKKLVA